MKTKIKTKLAALALALIVVVPSLHAQLNIPNADGSDGALNVTANTVIDLSQATNGVWTSPGQKFGFGTYDSSKWAVVFKYTSVNIAAGATLSFLNNPTHAPVVWLVSGNVTITGNLNLDGVSAIRTSTSLPLEPGPGGFRGGLSGVGFGPGGGALSAGGGYQYVYGNSRIVPLIGGSGGGSGSYGGGGGGGAILIAAAGTITINGTGYCHANGGGGDNYGAYEGGGSGGGIRLVAGQIVGNGAGAIQAVGTGIRSGGSGRIELEYTNGNYGSLSISPVPSTLTLTNGTSATIFPPNPSTGVSVVGVVANGQTNGIPSDPMAAIANSGNDDLRIVTTNSAITIQVQTINFPTNCTVNVYVTQPNGSVAQSPYTAIFDGGTTNQAYWHVSANLPYPNHFIFQARAYY